MEIILVALGIVLGLLGVQWFSSKKEDKLAGKSQELRRQELAKKEDLDNLEIEELGLEEAKKYWEKRRK